MITKLTCIEDSSRCRSGLLVITILNIYFEDEKRNSLRLNSCKRLEKQISCAISMLCMSELYLSSWTITLRCKFQASIYKILHYLKSTMAVMEKTCDGEVWDVLTLACTIRALMWAASDGVKVCAVVLSEAHPTTHISEFSSANEEINTEFLSLGCSMKVRTLNKLGH